MFTKHIVPAVLSAILVTTAAGAVFAADAHKAVKGTKANLNYSADHRKESDNYFSQVLGFEYGLTDYWKTELSGELEKENGAGDKLTNIKWENIFVPFKHGENWVDVGLYVELEKAARDNEPNNSEVKLLLEKKAFGFDNTANLILSHQFGPNHSTDTNAGMALQSLYRIDRSFSPGIEYYANYGALNNGPSFDDQNHVLGPVIEGKIGKVSYNTGVLFGVSKAAPDTTVKLNLEYEF